MDMLRASINDKQSALYCSVAHIAKAKAHERGSKHSIGIQQRGTRGQNSQRAQR